MYCMYSQIIQICSFAFYFDSLKKDLTFLDTMLESVYIQMFVSKALVHLSYIPTRLCMERLVFSSALHHCKEDCVTLALTKDPGKIKNVNFCFKNELYRDIEITVFFKNILM